jgi:hypothetical protein
VDEKDFEIAAQLEQLERDSAINKARQSARILPAPPDFDGTCDCGTEIPPKRIAMGYFRCVDCAFEGELKTRLGV